MALLSPIATSLLSAKDHAYMHRVIDVDEAATEGILTVDSSDGLNYGSATVNSGVFSMIQGAVASDPTFSITQLTNDVTLAQTIGNMGLTAAVNMGLTSTGGDILLATKLAGKVDWTNGNVIYLGIGDGTDDQVEINAAIAAATAGDTIVLAAGTYTITDEITAAKKIHLKGQGQGITTITCATDGFPMLRTTTQSGILISDMTLSMTGARTGTYTASHIKPEIGTTVRNVSFVDSTTGAVGVFTTAINMATASVAVDMYDCIHIASGDIGIHLFTRTNAASVILNMWRCSSVSSNGDAVGFGNFIAFAENGTANYYDCDFRSAVNTTGGVVYHKTTGATNVYNCTLNGSGATAFDVQQAGGTLTLYDTTLVNGTTSGTITYGGTVVTKNVNAVLGATDSFLIDADTTRTGDNPILDIDVDIDTTAGGNSVAIIDMDIVRNAQDTGLTKGIDLYMSGAAAWGSMGGFSANITTGAMLDTKKSYGFQCIPATNLSVAATSYFYSFWAKSPSNVSANCHEVGVKIGSGYDVALEIDNGIIKHSTEDLTATNAGVAASLLTDVTICITDAGGADVNNVSLAAGVAGQTKIFTFKTETTAGDTVVITPASPVGFATVTFDAIGQSVSMVSDGTSWMLTGLGNGTATVA